MSVRTESALWPGPVHVQATRSEFPRVVWEFIAAINAHDRRWLETLFDERCTVCACGYRAAGLPAVARWIDTEVVTASICLTLDDVQCEGSTTRLRVTAADHGMTCETEFTFRTEGRYIQSLEIECAPSPTPMF